VSFFSDGGLSPLHDTSRQDENLLIKIEPKEGIVATIWKKSKEDLLLWGGISTVNDW